MFVTQTSFRALSLSCSLRCIFRGGLLSRRQCSSFDANAVFSRCNVKSTRDLVSPLAIVTTEKEPVLLTSTSKLLKLTMEEKNQPGEVKPENFNAYTTALEVLRGQDLTGRVAIVTGANTGIGYETARALALHGCTVIFACRNLESAEAAVSKLKTEKETVNCHVMHLDLQSLENVKHFVREFQESYKTLDILILNAGVVGPFSLTPDGYETTFQVNHLSQFCLTLLLEPQLSIDKERESRVVIVASESHRKIAPSEENFTEDFLSPKSTTYWKGDLNAYKLSKLCNVLTAATLARRWREKNISVFSVHPGSMVHTDLGRQRWLYRLVFILLWPFTKSIEQGASTSVYCATTLPSNQSGSYVNDCQVCVASESAKNEKLAARLWDISIKMVTSVLGPDAFSQKF